MGIYPGEGWSLDFPLAFANDRGTLEQKEPWLLWHSRFSLCGWGNNTGRTDLGMLSGLAPSALSFRKA